MSRLLKTGFLCICSMMVVLTGACGTKNHVAAYDTANVRMLNLNPDGGGNNNAGAGTTNYLCYGYNVINYGYVDSQNINKRYAILDVARLTDTDFQRVSATRSDTTYVTSNYASTLLDTFNAKASVKYKGALFSGSLKTEYSLTQGLDETSKLIKYIGYYRVYEMYLTANNTRIKALLADQFKADLADPRLLSSDPAVYNQAIDALFANYGTHLFQEYYLGGRFNLNFNYDSTTAVNDSDLKVDVEATYANFTGSGSADSQQKSKTVTDHSSLTFEAVGGMLMSGNDAASISKQFPDWLKSLDTSNDICEIGAFDSSMLPIWELTDNAQIKSRLQARFDTLLEQADLTLKGYDPKPLYLSDIWVVARGSSQDAINSRPDGYTWLCVNPGTNNNGIMDANYSVGGDYIYIAYKLTADKSQAIYDIQVRDGANLPSSYTDGGHTYQIRSVDLNKGAHGAYIYLFYSMANASDTQYIKEIRGVYSGSSEFVLPAGWGWEKNRMDLNKGAGGKFIFLAYRMGP